METLLSWAVGIGLVLDLGMALEGRRKQRTKLQGWNDLSASVPLHSLNSQSILRALLEDAFPGCPCVGQTFFE